MHLVVSERLHMKRVVTTARTSVSSKWFKKYEATDTIWNEQDAPKRGLKKHIDKSIIIKTIHCYKQTSTHKPFISAAQDF